MSPSELRRLGFTASQIRAAKPQGPKKGSGDQGFLSSLIGEAGGLGGAAGGAAIGTALLPGIGTVGGALLGSFLGATGGQAVENKVRDDEFRIGDAAKFGAVEGVFSAGPLRLAKGAVTGAKALRGGTNLAEALVKAGDDAANFSIRGAARAGTNKAAQKAAGRFSDANLGLSPTQFENIQKSTGMDVQDILKRENLFGKSSKDISSKLSELNREFSEKIKNVRDLDISTIQTKFQEKLTPLLNDVNPDIQVIGQRAAQKGDEIIANLTKRGATGTAVDLNKLKSSLADTVNYKKVANDPDLADVNKVLADGLREAIQDASGNRTLRDLGLRIRDLNEVAAPLAKQVNKGRGSRLVNLTSGQGVIGGAVAGGALGGPVAAIPGGLVGALAAKAANTPRGARALTRGADSIASRTSGTGSRGLTPARAGIGALTGSALTGGSPEDQSVSVNTDTPITSAIKNSVPNTANNISDNNISQTVNQVNPQTAQQLIAQAQLAVLEQGGSLEDAMEIAQVVPLLLQAEGINVASAAQTESAGLELNNSAIGTLTDLQTGIDNLQILENRIVESSANSPLLGSIRSANPFDTDAKALRSEIDRVRQVVGKALEGGVLRKEDEEKYKRILPVITDTDEVAVAKISAIRNDLQNRLNEFMGNQSRFSGNATLENALIDAGSF